MDPKMEHKLAKSFAPMGWLHRREKYFPMSADDFAAASELWKRDGGIAPECTVGRSRREVGVGKIQDQSWLTLDGKPGKDRRPPMVGTRPNCGSYQLWLEHKGKKEGSKSTDCQNIKEPVYYSVRHCGQLTLVGYWFFFAYSHFGTALGHQGDWETVSVLVRDGCLEKAWFNSHGVYAERSRDDLLFADSGKCKRINVYFAKSRHGTYWKAGIYWAIRKNAAGPVVDIEGESPWHGGLVRSVLERKPVWFWKDDVTDPCYKWDAKDRLVSLSSRPWSEYSGGWGKRGRFGCTTGPSGPWIGKRRRLERMLTLDCSDSPV